MGRKQPKRKQLTYHEMENALREITGWLQEATQRISNLEYIVTSYIEFRKTGKRYDKWLTARHEQASKERDKK